MVWLRLMQGYGWAQAVITPKRLIELLRITRHEQERPSIDYEGTPCCLLEIQPYGMVASVDNSPTSTGYPPYFVERPKTVAGGRPDARVSGLGQEDSLSRQNVSVNKLGLCQVLRS